MRDRVEAQAEGIVDSEDLLVSAALLGRGEDSEALVADLAARLERALPGRVSIERSGWGKGRKVKSLTVDLDQERFRVEVDRRGPSCWADQIVREIRLRSEQLGMDEWLERLAAGLSREARKSVEQRLAIEDALR